MADIKSESQFIWRLLLDILLIPWTLLLIIFRKKELKDLLKPFSDIFKFIFEAKFTISIIIITIFTSLAAVALLSDAAFDLLLNYPEDILHLSRFYSLITAGFIHSSLSHLIGNMIGIFIFGRVVERKFGFGKTMIIYFGALIISSLGDSIMGLILGVEGGGLGASGALMGLVATAILINPFYITYELIIPLPIMVDGWMFILADFAGIISPAGDGVAHFAHIFGYLSITLIMFLLGGEERSKMKKGLLINLGSLLVLGFIYFIVGF